MNIAPVCTGFLLAAGATWALAAEMPAQAARIPLAVFGIAGGDPVKVAGQEALAEEAGLPLPVGAPVEVGWTAQGQPVSYRIICITADSGPAVPAWHLDDPVVQADGGIIAVGHGYASTVGMALAKATADARLNAVRTTPGQVTSTVSEEVGPGQTDAGGKQVVTRRWSSQTRMVHNTDVASETTDCVITVSADPATAPPVPGRPGVELRLVDRPGLMPVRCWVRVSARAKPGEAGSVSPMSKEEAERAFRDLDRRIDEELRTTPNP